MAKKLSLKKRIINDFLVGALLMGAVGVLSTTLVNAYNQNETELMVQENIKSGTSTTIQDKAGGNTNSILKRSAVAILPFRLTIPSLSIDAQVDRVGISEKGNMMSPKNFKNVGWYRYGAMPGAVGNSYIVGHVDNSFGLDGVFKNLQEINKGDLIYVSSEEGIVVSYRVDQMFVTDYDLSLSEAVSEKKDISQLVLITCYGSWIAKDETYGERLIVVAEQVQMNVL